MTADLEITRKRRPVDNGWKKGRDSFKISSALCSKKFDCKTFNAEEANYGDGCTCSCSGRFSTFIFYNKTWGCRENEKVRTLLGGNTSTFFRFKDENKRNELHMLNMNEERKLKLNPNKLNCTQESARYFKCGDSEDVLPERSPFALIAKDKNYFIKVEEMTSKDFLKGRIIRLKITCTNARRGLARSGVLLFKYEGSLNCSITIPFNPNTDGKLPSTPLIAGVTTAILVLLVISSLLVYRRQYLKRDPHPKGESHDRQETETPCADPENGTDNENGLTELAYREPAVFASSYQAPVSDREAHLSGETENNDSSNGEHIYASLNISEGPSVYGHRDDQDNCPMSKDQAVYSLIEELNVAQPVHNSFEEPRRDVSRRPGQYGIVSSDEPVHSTLEETAHCFDDGTLPTQRNLEVPYLKDVEESIQYRTTGPKEPVYNTLEEPVGDDDNDPVYNTLEAPEGAEDPLHPSAVSTEEPIRHTLEQSNPNIS
ncbi:uncharacterized protein LOC113679909 [Pocillopora damicornis]|uniref:uncharacterized protein LOC113679909 n=1 Tax=Pocillopora damicornis TaxID=46731 RepID=UPI000F55954D|nr:uncharacterized protein LOC113679909 [Pocillopora damicornis]